VQVSNKSANEKTLLTVIAVDVGTMITALLLSATFVSACVSNHTIGH
jgi:hypothetical protein